MRGVLLNNPLYIPILLSNIVLSVISIEIIKQTIIIFKAPLDNSKETSLRVVTEIDNNIENIDKITFFG